MKIIRTNLSARRPRLTLTRLGRLTARRRGSMTALMSLLLPVLAMLAAFSINAAHMQLTRTEVIVATDAAAKAAGRAFSEIQTVEAAKDAGRITASMNMVNGTPLLIREEDSFNEIEFGTTTQNGQFGRYEFQKIPTSAVANGSVIASAVRIKGLREPDSLSGRVPLMLPGILGLNEFSTSQWSVAMQVDRDISLVLDRSGSMDDVDFDWPSGSSPWSYSAKVAGVNAGMLNYYSGRFYYASGVDSVSYQQWAWEEYYNLGEAPRPAWDWLLDSVDAFINVLDQTSQEEQIAIASYSTSARLDAWLSMDHTDVSDTVHDMNTGGWTAIGLGMEEGIRPLLDTSRARPYAAKTMVVMTDGMHNTDIDPVTVAENFMSQYALTIHTVTFGPGADIQRMQEVAEIGGGRHYHADTGEELIEIFEEIANNLPTILTK